MKSERVVVHKTSDSEGLSLKQLNEIIEMGEQQSLSQAEGLSVY